MAPSWQSGFFDIDLSKVPERNLPTSWQASKSYTHDQMSKWMQDVKVIQQLCREKSYTTKDFQRLRHSQNPVEQSLGHTYHKLYNHDVSGPNMNGDYIKVDWVGDRYEVVNGRHRLALAKQTGLKHLPAHVSAPNRAILERLRSDGECLARGATPQPLVVQKSPATPLNR
ncbi:MAG: hypothetical protein ACFB0C_02385 [Leptolyngbyaceae cyanobacterium]